MRRLLVVLGLLSSLTGFGINSNQIQDIFNSPEFTVAEKATAADVIATELEETVVSLQDGTFEFNHHNCNN